MGRVAPNHTRWTLQIDAHQLSAGGKQRLRSNANPRSNGPAQVVSISCDRIKCSSGSEIHYTGWAAIEMLHCSSIHDTVSPHRFRILVEHAHPRLDSCVDDQWILL